MYSSFNKHFRTQSAQQFKGAESFYRCQRWIMMTGANLQRTLGGMGLRAADWAAVGDGGRPEEVGTAQEQDMLRQPATHCYSCIHRRLHFGGCASKFETICCLFQVGNRDPTKCYFNLAICCSRKASCWVFPPTAFTYVGRNIKQVQCVSHLSEPVQHS